MKRSGLGWGSECLDTKAGDRIVIGIKEWAREATRWPWTRRDMVGKAEECSGDEGCRGLNGVEEKERSKSMHQSRDDLLDLLGNYFLKQKSETRS